VHTGLRAMALVRAQKEIGTMHLANDIITELSSAQTLLFSSYTGLYGVQVDVAFHIHDLLFGDIQSRSGDYTRIFSVKQYH